MEVAQSFIAFGTATHGRGKCLFVFFLRLFFFLIIVVVVIDHGIDTSSGDFPHKPNGGGGGFAYNFDGHSDQGTGVK